jgi:hypothetical protein
MLALPPLGLQIYRLAPGSPPGVEFAGQSRHDLPLAGGGRLGQRSSKCGLDYIE